MRVRPLWHSSPLLYQSVLIITSFKGWKLLAGGCILYHYLLFKTIISQLLSTVITDCVENMFPGTFLQHHQSESVRWLTSQPRLLFLNVAVWSILKLFAPLEITLRRYFWLALLWFLNGPRRPQHINWVVGQKTQIYWFIMATVDPPKDSDLAWQDINFSSR